MIHMKGASLYPSMVSRIFLLPFGSKGDKLIMLSVLTE